MALAQREKTILEKNLDKCDAALADKPTLSSIYEPTWRLEFRQLTLQTNSMREVSYPSAYAAPIFEWFFPPCYQYRLEEGAHLLLPLLCKRDKNHLITRMRGNGCPSAEEELLLARGFALEFGKDSIVPPSASIGSVRPEFTVCISNIEIDIEAKGLLDSDQVRMLNETARQQRQNFWITDDSINDIGRIQSTLLRKVTAVKDNRATIFVLSQHSAWPDVRDSILLLRDIVCQPSKYSIPSAKIPVAIAYVSGHLIQGVWFNPCVTAKFDISEDLCERLRQAIKNSFYPRSDLLFFTEISGG